MRNLNSNRINLCAHLRIIVKIAAQKKNRKEIRVLNPNLFFFDFSDQRHRYNVKKEEYTKQSKRACCL